MEVPEEPNLVQPKERLLQRGPDAMRLSPEINAIAFIFTPTERIFYGKPGQGHENIIDLHKNETEAWEVLTNIWTPQELKKVGEETSDQGEPFADWMRVRLKAGEKALFGRVGTLEGRSMVMFWPGGNNFYQLLNKCLEKLLQDKLITQDTLITVGSSAKYTVKHYLAHKPSLEEPQPKIKTAFDIKQARDLEKAKGRWPYELYPEWKTTFKEWLKTREPL